MGKSVNGVGSEATRRQYATPTLVVHGTLVELTHSLGDGGKSAGAPYGNAYGHSKFPPKS
jgi:hypothetical protein